MEHIETVEDAKYAKARPALDVLAGVGRCIPWSGGAEW